MSLFFQKIWYSLMHLCRTVLQWLLHPFHITITDDTWFVWEQFIKFALVGCSNAVVTLIVYNIMVLLFGAGIYLYAQTIGYIAGIVNSFFWNSRFVFNSGEQKSANAFVKMCLCYGITYFLQMGLLYVFVERCGLSAFLSPVLAILITTPVNFILNKIWAFHEKS